VSAPRTRAWLAARPEALLALALAGAGVGWQLAALHHPPGEAREWLILAERLLCIGLLAWLLAAGLGWLAGAPRRPAPAWRQAALFGGLLALALGVRLAVEPVLLHVEFVGLKYAELSLDPAALFGQDGSYGQAGFLTQGLLARALGGSLGALFLANTLVAVAALGLAAALVRRWTGSQRLAPAVAILLAGLSPILVRTAASEDVHVIGAFYALLSLWLLERHLQSGRARDLGLAVAACLLAACSRQFLLPMPILFLLLLLERRGLRAAARAPAALALGLLALGALLRWAVLLPGLLSAAGGAQFGAGGQWSGMWRTFLALAGLALEEPHPLLDQALFPLPLALLLVLGLVEVARRGRAPRALLLAWLFLLLLSLGTPFGGIQVRYLFRSLLVQLSLLLAALGWHAAHAWLRARWPGRAAPAALAALGLALPLGLCLPTLVRDRGQDPFTREVLLLEASVADLPDELVLYRQAEADGADRNLYHGLPRFLFDRQGKRVALRPLGAWRAGGGDPGGPPEYVWVGAGCFAASVFETDPRWERPDELVARADPAEIARFFRPAHPGDAFILQRRRACHERPELRLGPGDLRLTIEPAAFTPGNLFYVSRPFEIGLRRLSPPAR